MISDPAQSLQPAAAYLRRSTDRQEQSLHDQRKEILRWAAQNGFQVVREYIDDAISGTSAKSRPDFQRMISDAKTGRFVAVIVWNSDRFSRGDVTETEHFRYLLREAGVTVHSVTEDYLAREGLDGDVLRAVKQSQNRQYSVSLSQNTLRGQISNVLKSSDPGQMNPYGYDREILGPDGAVLYRVRFLEGGDRETFDRDGRPLARYVKGQSLAKPGKECSARLVLGDEKRVQTVRDIFNMCVAGKGFKPITAELNRRGILSPRGRLWQFTTIKNIVENPVYRGDIVWNRRTQSKFFEVRAGRAEKVKSTIRSGTVQKVLREDWIVMENAVPAIVERVNWDRAQAAASARSDQRGGKGKQACRWLLSGVLRCAHCGQPFWGEKKRKGHVEGRAEVVTSYYICAGRCRSGKSVCPFPGHVKAEQLEVWVLEQLQEMVFQDSGGVEEAIEWFINAVRSAHPTDGAIRAHQREIAQIDAQVDALVAHLDAANLALVNGKMTNLRTRKEWLQQQVRAAEMQEASLDEKALRSFATERIGMLAEIMGGRRDEKARQVIASYIDEIVIEPETKTGYMAVNAGLFGEAPDAPDGGAEAVGESEANFEAAPAHGPTSANGSQTTVAADALQKPDDPPRGGSQVKVIAGVGFEPTTSGL